MLPVVELVYTLEMLVKYVVSRILLSFEIIHVFLVGLLSEAGSY